MVPKLKKIVINLCKGISKNIFYVRFFSDRNRFILGMMREKLRRVLLFIFFYLLKHYFISMLLLVLLLLLWLSLQHEEKQ